MSVSNVFQGEVLSSDLLHAFRQAFGMKDDGQRLELIFQLVKAADKKDLMKLIPQMEASFSIDEKLLLFTSIVEVWADSDLKGASEFVLSLSPSYAKWNSLSVLAEAWVKQDPQGAIHWSESLQEKRLQGKALQSIVKEWARLNPLAAGNYARNIPTSVTREYALSRVAEKWGHKDPAAALEWAEVLLEDPFHNQFVGAILEGWADVDLRAASNYLASLPSDGGHIGAVDFIAGNLEMKDHQKAMEWVQKLPPGKTRTQALESMVEHMNMSEIAFALDADSLAVLLKNDPQEIRVLDLLVRQWGTYNPEMPIKWVLKMEDDKLREKLLPAAAAAWVREDPQAVAAWAENIPEGALRQSVIPAIMKQWSWDWPGLAEDAEVWLETLSLGHSRDLAIQAGVTEAHLPIQWAEKIEDEALRQDTLSKAAEKWLEEDPEEAKAWIANSSLTKKRKEKLLKK